ncbi:MAG: hypothetical protein HC819_06235 [Cyclobacteriaceae bacterium]|nr:hypothetical protein [Cyclobacteriaceae bacterium]
MQAKKSIREENLRKILLTKFLPNSSIDTNFNMWELNGSFYEKNFLETYHALDGKEGTFPETRYTVPLMEFGRFSVVFDEAIHFNRYRGKTLRSAFYDNITSFPKVKYLSYCRKYEVECLKGGTARPEWTSREAERYFGEPQLPGDLGLSGAPGWKLTALTDLATDMIARKRKIRLLRISIWDDLLLNQKLVKFKDMLVSPGKIETESILKYVERKVFGLYADDF